MKMLWNTTNSIQNQLLKVKKYTQMPLKFSYHRRQLVNSGWQHDEQATSRECPAAKKMHSGQASNFSSWNSTSSGNDK